MKKSLLAGMLLALTLNAHASDNDTIVINNPKKVTVVTGDSLQKIVVRGREGDDNFVYRNTIQLVDSNYVSTATINKDRWELIPSVEIGKKQCDGTTNMDLTLRMGLGLVAPHHIASGADFNTGQSREIFFSLMLNNFLTKNRKDYISYGLGIDWRNYRMTAGQRFLKDAEGKVILADYPEGATSDYSRIKVFALTGTILYNHDFKHGWGLGVGIVGNWNTYASLETQYRQDGGKHSFLTKHIGQRHHTLDYMGVIKTPTIDFYLKYSPHDVLSNDGVKFRSLTFGLYL